MLRSPRHRLYSANPRHPLQSRRARRWQTETLLGGTKDRGLVRGFQRSARMTFGEIYPELRRTGSPRYKRRNSDRAGKLWIKGAIKHPGALRRKLSRGYVKGFKLGSGRIPETVLERAYAIARRKGDTRTMRQINLARRLRGFGLSRKATAKSTRARRLAANPRYGHSQRWTVKWRP